MVSKDLHDGVVAADQLDFSPQGCTTEGVVLMVS